MIIIYDINDLAEICMEEAVRASKIAQQEKEKEESRG